MSRTALLRRFIPVMALALLLAACILVDDFGEAWTQGKPDICLSKIAESLYYSEYRRDPAGKDMSQLAHAWVLDGHNFLLLKKDASDKGGRMYRFQVINGIFQRFRLVPTMRGQFEHDYPNAPVDLSRDTVTLKIINPQTEKLLDDIASRPEYWEVDDQTLYNTMRLPVDECHFEDRPPLLKDKQQ
jgi:hypothetical protein